ncbi:MAG: hypothetical protein A2Z91_05980 [Deltaproteobacteria bacterium GWA2_38_16]|nr:MAG: hypothetical protein A2Z91_05980 [Deltaproteobacteria bacterium GWA2_38_16]OGQ03764.1 MAG: hypothetical protein A3D19_02830 [Deltaproteobacteria bacterium RIFCSPHIGHO2_02_FULL_38_15]OGQ33290.1 MAG: hypothetical protein A3A72_02225 [Deltaproteobacteria bacterium RIFCSPLOWO2_01_FULL_38_9]OGQ60700.1 MAG: hypothetical protein A3G92_02335 [Deltaproteobacteria bacterium RIFCSPLOWO2_12_FULL_38_8]HBQ21326.1 hypothetical protein [Deltaproteobacteria bacterium]
MFSFFGKVSYSMPQALIVKKKIITNTLVIMWLKPDEPFTFKPGQYCTVGIQGLERPYSIASAPPPYEELIEFFLEVVPQEQRTEKSLSPKLYDLPQGETVTLRPTAKGHFLLEENYPTQVMVSTTTCITPYVSMLRAYLHGYYKTTFSKPIYVFHGASYQTEFGYFEELKTMEKTGKVIYIPTISRPTETPNQSWKGQTGRVNNILLESFKKFNISPSESLVYLCGNKKMIEAAKATLTQAGYKTKQEVFF